MEPSTSRFGTVGLDVGTVGRWSRLGWGVLILAPLVFEAVRDLSASGTSIAFYGRSGLYFLGILVGYVAVYRLLGERGFAKMNPWLNTLMLVGPAFIVSWWSIAIAPWAHILLPSGLSLGLLFYVGVSFILQWKIKYGGCEVVALPIVLFRRRYITYCVPLVALDAAEKAIIDRSDRARQQVTDPEV